MRKFSVVVCILLSTSSTAFAQKAQHKELVEIELMTHPEVYSAIHDYGKTTVLVFNGGTEQRGPFGILGFHTLTARATAVAIARKLGNALVAPVLPFSPTNAVLYKMPGGVSLPSELYRKVNEAVVDSMVTMGFQTSSSWVITVAAWISSKNWPKRWTPNTARREHTSTFAEMFTKSPDTTLKIGRETKDCRSETMPAFPTLPLCCTYSPVQGNGRARYIRRHPVQMCRRA